MIKFQRSLYLQSSSSSNVTVDCANGVGAEKLKILSKCISSDLLNVVVVNDGGEGSGKLNENCGADFVKLQQKAPAGDDSR